MIVGLISCAFSVTITQYSISRFVLGLGMYGCSGTVCTSCQFDNLQSFEQAHFHRNYFLVLESCGPKHRSDIYMIAGFGWVFGYVVIPGMAYWLKDFQLMNIYAIVPIILSLVWFYFIPESPRWLITNGRLDYAEQTLKNILKRNQMSDENFDQKFLELKTHLLRVRISQYLSVI